MHLVPSSLLVLLGLTAVTACDSGSPMSDSAPVVTPPAPTSVLLPRVGTYHGTVESVSNSDAPRPLGAFSVTLLDLGGGRGRLVFDDRSEIGSGAALTLDGTHTATGARFVHVPAAVPADSLVMTLSADGTLTGRDHGRRLDYAGTVSPSRFEMRWTRRTTVIGGGGVTNTTSVTYAATK